MIQINKGKKGQIVSKFFQKKTTSPGGKFLKFSKDKIILLKCEISVCVS